MLNIIRLQRLTLSVLIGFYLTGLILAGMLFLGVYLWANKTNDRSDVKDISYSEISSSLRYKGDVLLPAWGIARISLNDDQSTSPSVTVDFDNGVTVMLSKSSFTVRSANEFPAQRGGLTYFYILPERMNEFELAMLKNEITESATPRTADSGLRSVAF